MALFYNPSKHLTHIKHVAHMSVLALFWFKCVHVLMFQVPIQ